MSDEKRFTVAEVEEIIETAIECRDAHRDHLRCLHELAALRELGNRFGHFEEGGKYCRTCGEKSSWDAIAKRDPEAQNHLDWCVVPEWLRLVPKDNAHPLRYRFPTRTTVEIAGLGSMKVGDWISWLQDIWGGGAHGACMPQGHVLEAIARKLAHTSVGGDAYDGTVESIVLRCERWIVDEQTSILPDNGLIALLCDMVRLIREPFQGRRPPPIDTGGAS